ncbi:NAD-dependent malic enzyme [Enterobacter asburiae]|uniref:NAD-dependent malic enzyme n=1 Tax=Enterobacter asburiae TaxID=61645 RepID=A0A376FAD6_ENTAS|nr:NAD-dependent malic enzyme [Enterobacter asburiae]
MGIPIGKTLSLHRLRPASARRIPCRWCWTSGPTTSSCSTIRSIWGWRHPRITDDEYYQFVDDFIQAVKHRWPDVLLQFEDFAQKNAMPLLNRYRDGDLLL